MSEVGIVIATHNSGEVIEACLDACAAYDAVVVDNASVDETISVVKRRPNIRVIQNRSNRGFAAAVNQGVAALDNEFVLLLNPDVELNSPIQALLAACRDDGCAMASGRLLDATGHTQTGFTIRRFPTPLALAYEVLGLNRLWSGNAINRRYRYLDADLAAAADVEQPAGAFLLFRRSLWLKLKGFDETFYPLWFEDVDFCKRAADLGYRCRYLPQVTARHLGAHSISKLPWASREVYWYGSLLGYASKHFRPWAFRGVSAAVVLGSIFRSVRGIVSRRSLRPVAVYAGVTRLAFLSLLYGRIPGPPGGSALVEG